MTTANAEQIKIDASPQQVWKAITDFDSYPQWNPMTPAMKGEVAVGAKLKGMLELGPLKVPFFPKLLTIDEPHELRWKGGVPGAFVADHRFIIEAAPGGGSILRHHEEFTGAFALKGPTEKTANGIHAKFNAACKQRAESHS